EFEQGNYRAAVDDVIGALVLARRIGADFPLICLMVQYAMEQPMIELTASYLSKMDAATLKHLASSLAALPSGGSVQRSVPGEKEWLIAGVTKALKVGDERNWKNARGKVTGRDDKEALATLQAAGPLTPRWRMKLLKDLGAHYDESLKLLSL